ncbi:hypothetical protein [Rhizobium binxianense]
MRMDFYKSLRLVFLGAILAFAAVVVVIDHLMSTLTSIANEQDFVRSTRSVEAAIRTELEKLSGVLIDNAIWSDAVESIYDQVNTDCLNRMWGKSVDQGALAVAVSCTSFSDLVRRRVAPRRQE